MRSEAPAVTAAVLLSLLGACGGFGRGEPSPPGACEPDGTPAFDADVQPILRSRCGSCHTSGGSAGDTDFVLSGSVAEDHAGVLTLLDLEDVEASTLLDKAVGNDHGGGTALSATSADYDTIGDWIAAGAPLSAACPADMDASVDADAGEMDADVDAGPTEVDGSADDGGVDAGATDANAGDAGDMGDAGGDGSPSDAGPTTSFASDVHPVLEADCQVCHSETGAASTSGLVLTGDANTDYAAVLAFVDEDAPASSPLLTKTLGMAHGGGERFDVDSSEYALFLEWIEAGAAP